MREGLLTGPYLVAGVCGVSFLNEGRSDRESWNQGGGEGQGTKTLNGKCMFSLKLKRKEMNLLWYYTEAIGNLLPQMSLNHRRLRLWLRTQ